MATKKPKRSTKGVKGLKAKRLTATQAKGVKGGIVVVNSRIQQKCLPSGLLASKYTKW